MRKFKKYFGAALGGLMLAGLGVLLIAFYRPTQTKNIPIAAAVKAAGLRQAAASGGLPEGLLHVPILMYHHIGSVPAGAADSIRIGLTISPREFSEQVSWLKSQGYNSISLNQLYLYTQGKFTLPKKPVIFTFDDGYDDAFSNAVPILQSAGYTGAFGIITDFPGTVSGTNSYAAWPQIAAARQAGMEIICHTQNHFDGGSAKFDAGYIYQNLSGCQQALAAHLGSAEPFLIYPYGHTTAAYVAQMQALGFKMGLIEGGTSWIQPWDLFHVPRVRVTPNEPLDKFIQNLGR